MNPGGGEEQLLNTKKALEELKVQISLYDMWAPQKDIDILHQFSINPGVEHVVKEYKNLGKKIALSPIFWAKPEAGTHLHFQVKSLLETSDVILTNSHQETELLSEHFNISKDKFSKVRNCITEDYFTIGDPEIARKEFNLPKKFILSIANIDQRKNTRRLLEAAQINNSQVVLVGHIRDQEYWKEIQNEFKNYLYLGPINNKNILKSLILSSSAFALPSLCETPGISAIEACSQGASIVVTSEGPTEEYFKEHVLYADPLNIEEISLKLKEAFEIKRDQKALQEFVLENYTWDKAGQDTLNAYRRVLS